MSKHKETPEELWEHIARFVLATQEHVSNGGDADLSGLDAKVQELCDAILDLPREEAAVYEERLGALGEALETLKLGLENVQGDIEAELSSLDRRQKAAKAYTTAAVPPVKPE
ncbi:MAG: hypothetical protein FJX23_02875 [Alphaproteobacteria bacterium]|nr:hypothetical protein [Alphaproteobacteria bacterium]